MHPNQFHVDQAWIVFKLNDEPLRTDRDELFNIVCLMDAASCFIFGNAYVPNDQSEPSTMEFESLLEKGWSHHQQLPSTLFVPIGQFPTNIPEEAERQGIAVMRVREGDLIPFIREARQSFVILPRAAAKLICDGGQALTRRPRRALLPRKNLMPSTERRWASSCLP